jgi:hypothetical protein
MPPTKAPDPPARKLWKRTIAAGTNAGGLAAATCRPGQEADLAKLAEAVRASTGGKDIFEPIMLDDASVQSQLSQPGVALPAEGKERLAELAPPDGETLADLLLKEEPKPDDPPRPAADSTVVDAQWALEQWGSGRFAEYSEQYVAVYGQKVVGAGNDPVELATRHARAFGVSQNRIVIKYIGRED